MNLLEVPIDIRCKLTTPYDLGLIAAEIMQNYSHDPKKQTGAAIVDKSYNIYGLGSNTYPHGKTVLFRDQELLKSNNFDNEHRFRLEHAERNAIAFAVRNENPLKNTTMSVSYTPCVDCANSICNMGITELVDASVPNFTHHRWGAGWEYVVKDLFPRCGVKYLNYVVDPKVKDKVLFSLEQLIDKYYVHSR
jgi:deoxycytidylate deaminase